MAEEKIRTSPDVRSYVNQNDNKLYIEVSLAGVKKENRDGAQGGHKPGK